MGGRSTQELFAKYQDQQRDHAATSGQHSMRAGGVFIVAGGKRKDLEQEADSDEERMRDRERQSGPSLEQQAKRAAIEQKYCARVTSSQSQGRRDGGDGAERMRLG